VRECQCVEAAVPSGLHGNQGIATAALCRHARPFANFRNKIGTLRPFAALHKFVSF
jgi:hypothetical protein